MSLRYDDGRIERQRRDKLVDNLGNWTHGLDFSPRYAKIDLEACSNHGFFPCRGPTEGARCLSTNRLRYTQFEMERWQEHERGGTLLDLLQNAPVRGMNVP
jgi:hypothetical protein